MTITREQIEQLQRHAGVTFEDAQAALEACSGDPLDALVWLERTGKIPASGVHTFGTDGTDNSGPVSGEPPYGHREPVRGTFLRTAWRWLADNRLEVCRRSDNLVALEVPIIALIALLALAWWLVLILLGVGFLVGYRYRLAGPNLGRNTRVQDVMEQIDDNMESVVDQMKRGLRGD